jgi:hypothetical protein
MEFEIYIARLSETLGDAHLPLNAKWRRAGEIVRADAIHYRLISKIVADLFRRGRCSKPADPITMEMVLDYLGELKHDLREHPDQDFDPIDLVERIGEASVCIFHAREGVDDTGATRPGSGVATLRHSNWRPTPGVEDCVPGTRR